MIIPLLLSINVFITPVTTTLDELTELKPTTPEVQRIYLVRHGQSEFNVPDANGVKYMQGKGLEVPLTEKGREQARDLGIRLAQKLSPEEPLLILSSAALRAKDTADKIYEQVAKGHLAVRGGVYDEFCEIGKGEWEGKPEDEEAMQPWRDLPARVKFDTPKLPGAENNYHESGLKAMAALQEIVNENPGQTIILVSHSGLMHALTILWNIPLDTLSNEPGTPLPFPKFHNGDIIMVELPAGTPVEKATAEAHILNK